MRKPQIKVSREREPTYKNSIIERKIVPILEIPVDSTRKSKVLSDILRSLSFEAGRKLFIVTPNPEILVAAAKDANYASILRSASLSLPDGIGVIMAQKYISAPISNIAGWRFVDMLKTGMKVGLSVFFNRNWLFAEGEVVPGRVIFEELVDMAAQRGWRVCLLGGRNGVAQKAAQYFTRREDQQGNKISILADSGPWLNEVGETADSAQAKVEKETVKRINKFKPHLLFVAFGHPKQEFWVHKHLSNLNVRAVMVVGGAFDYTAGVVPNVPQAIGKAGFEWLWRLITQPWRAKRIATALFVFPWLIFLSRVFRNK